MMSTPCSAASASGRMRPWVSEMTPIRGERRAASSEPEGARSPPAARCSLRPDTRFLRPDGILVSLLERLSCGFERARIVRCFIARYARPVRRFRGGVGARQLLGDVAELPLGVGEVFLRELRVPESELQLAEEFVGGEVALDAVELLAIGVDDEHCRR